MRLPDVRLPATSGRTVDLAAEAGRAHLVLFFYPGDREGLRYPELAGCTPEACAFRDALADFAAADCLVLGVNLHATSRQREFVEREQLGFELLSDTEQLLTDALGVAIWRSSAGEAFVVRSTVVVRRGGTVVHAEEVTDPVEHVARILAVVRGLPASA
jgi:thioredoxin-dependent peroxiredoxin